MSDLQNAVPEGTAPEGTAPEGTAPEGSGRGNGMSRRAIAAAFTGAVAGFVGATVLTEHGFGKARQGGFPIQAELTSYPVGPADWLAPCGTDPTGATDSANIAAALAKGPVFLQAGTFVINQRIVIPGGGILRGVSGIPVAVSSSQQDFPGTVITYGTGFADTALIEVAGAFAVISELNLNGNNGTAQPSGLDGIYVDDTGGGLRMENVGIFTVSHNGINMANTAKAEICARNVIVAHAGNNGFSCMATDSTWDNCYALGCKGSGFYIAGEQANSKWINCRSEWSAGPGWVLTGSWNNGPGSGGLLMSQCSTDRSGKAGIEINATGNMPLVISGFMARRDGSSGGYAAVQIDAATIPVMISDLSVYPGVNDDGTGAITPVTGIETSGPLTYVSLVNAFIHAYTTPISGSTPISAYRAVVTRTGPTNSPSAVTMLADSA